MTCHYLTHRSQLTGLERINKRRSGTSFKRGLQVANGVGIIDPDYSGPDDEVMIQVLNFTNADVQVRHGDRLAQGIVLPAPRVVWHEVADIRHATRGGFGATGN